MEITFRLELVPDDAYPLHGTFYNLHGHRLGVDKRPPRKPQVCKRLSWQAVHASGESSWGLVPISLHIR